MLTVEEFIRTYPDFAFDFLRPLGTQPRIHDPLVIENLPVELQPTHDYRPGGRGRANRNQTRTHFQCGACRRVMRNDHFYSPPSRLRENGVHSYCLQCSQERNAQHYEQNVALVARRQNDVWRYLAPCCALCGFEQHISAMDMHHVHENKDSLVSSEISELALAPSLARAEQLLQNASRCLALCSNCHRMVHAGVVDIPSGTRPLQYHLADLWDIVQKSGKG